MDVEQRSLKYIEYHMFETFDPIFMNQMQVDGFWHNDNGYPRYESVVENMDSQEGNNISYLFPVFDPNSDEYDTYVFGEED